MDINKLDLTKGLRFSEGKLRYELIPQSAEKGLAEVFTYGANKYTVKDKDGKLILDGADNWRNGLSWRKTAGSLRRHLAAYMAGEDYDSESGLLHIDHVLTNAAFLKEFYTIHPELDDRPRPAQKKIGFDIDEVLCKWVDGWHEEFGTNKAPLHWNFSYGNHERFKSLSTEDLNRIYGALKPNISPSELTLEPHCYITARSVDQSLTEAWIEANGFPTAPVYSVGFGESKLQIAKDAGVEIFLDDNYNTYREFNDNGIVCFLWDAPHNQKYNVGYRRVKTMKEFSEKIGY